MEIEKPWADAGSDVLLCSKCRRAVHPGMSSCIRCAMRTSGFTEAQIEGVARELTVRLDKAENVNCNAALLFQVMHDILGARRSKRFKAESEKLDFGEGGLFCN